MNRRVVDTAVKAEEGTDRPDTGVNIRLCVAAFETEKR